MKRPSGTNCKWTLNKRQERQAKISDLKGGYQLEQYEAEKLKFLTKEEIWKYEQETVVVNEKTVMPMIILDEDMAVRALSIV